MLSKGARVLSLIVVLVVLGSVFSSLVSAEEVSSSQSCTIYAVADGYAWSGGTENPSGASSTADYLRVGFRTASGNFRTLRKFDLSSIPTSSTLSFTSLTPSQISTSAAPYDATLSASGSNFNNVNRITFSWTGASGSGSVIWNKGDTNWNAKVTVNSDNSMTLRPRVVEPDPTWSGTDTWTVTLRDTAGATASKSFTVTYEPQSVQPPDPPIITSPGSSSSPGPEISTITPTFQWTGVLDADYYGLYISEHPYDSTNIVFESNKHYGPLYGTPFTLPRGYLEKGKKYRWYMNSYDSEGGWGDVSSDRYFQVVVTPENHAPNLPTNLVQLKSDYSTIIQSGTRQANGGYISKAR